MDRARKLSRCERNDNMGKLAFSYLPPSLGRRCPEGAEVGSRYEPKGMCGASRYPLSSPLLPDRERKLSRCKRNDNMGKPAFSYLPPSLGRRCPEGAEVGCRYELKGMCGASRYPLSSPLLPDRERKRFLSCARNGTARAPSIPPRKGSRDLFEITGSFLGRGSLNSLAYPFPPAASPVFCR